MKFVLIIGDGMADDPLAELGGKTPLQYANIPAMDMLAGSGVFGNVLTVPEGMSAGSDTAILSIFGCDPRSCFAGRAPLEAAAMGIKLSLGDVAYRCNMISIESGAGLFDNKKIVSHSSGAINGAQSDELIRDLFADPVFKVAADNAGIKIYPGSSFRHIAVQVSQDKGKTRGSSPCLPLVLLTPPHDHIGECVGQYLPTGGENAQVLEKLIRMSYDFLDKHPINIKRRADGKLPADCIWFWAEGTAVELPNFYEKYGKTGSVISAVPLCQGIGVLIGLDKVVVEGATGELYTNYEGKTDAALKALETHDFAVIHIEAPDECTHNGDLKGKIQAVEWIDSRVIAPLIKRLDLIGDDYRMLVLSDHRTLSSTRGHAGGPVPYVIYDSRFSKNTGLKFSEEDAAKGEFITDGTKLPEILFDLKLPG